MGTAMKLMRRGADYRVQAVLQELHLRLKLDHVVTYEVTFLTALSTDQINFTRYINLLHGVVRDIGKRVEHFPP